MAKQSKVASEASQVSQASRKPPSPRLIFWLALILPGAGHAYMGQPMRGLTFIFFIIMLFWVGIRLFPDLSFIGKHLGGIFVWGLSVIDAYKISKIASLLDKSSEQTGAKTT